MDDSMVAIGYSGHWGQVLDFEPTHLNHTQMDHF